jgi:prolyl-tRNA synthetase
MVLGMTHEEIITWLASRELRSYRDLPQIWYQIQTKLRDEARPKSGILRTREFIMKDSYSFDVDEDALQASYQLHIEAYNRIFQRCGIDFYMVESDPGMMGGATAHEYMAPSPAGEDEVALCPACGYAANLELARSVPHTPDYPQPGIEEVETPGARTIEEVSSFLSIDPALLIKSLLVMAADEPVLVMVRGDQELQESKLARLLGDFRPAHEDEIKRYMGAGAGFIGPVGPEMRMIADESLRDGVFTVGANREGYHLKGVSPAADFHADFHDVRRVRAGERCLHCNVDLKVERVIEVGNIFKLGTKYSEPLGATYLDESGKEELIIMGSYGIGPARIAAAAIEQGADEKGIVWPSSIAPFHVHLVLVQPRDSRQAAMAEKINTDLTGAGLEVLFDERDISPGVKFADAELLGCPLRVTIGKHSAAEGTAELQLRRDGTESKVELGAAAEEAVGLLEGMD